METPVNVLGLTAKLLGYGARVALLGLGFLILDGLLKLSIEPAGTIGLLSLFYLLLYGIGAIVVSGYQDGQQRERARAEALAAARKEAEDPVTGEPSVLTPEQWAAVTATQSGRALADPAKRWQFEAILRSDPDKLQEMRRDLAKIQSDRDSPLSPLAKRWLTRVIIGLVVGLIVLANQQK